MIAAGEQYWGTGEGCSYKLSNSMVLSRYMFLDQYFKDTSSPHPYCTQFPGALSSEGTVHCFLPHFALRTLVHITTVGVFLITGTWCYII